MKMEIEIGKVNLARNPEGYKDPKRCPICKKEIKVDSKGGMFCSNYSPDYEKSGKCYWHRYSNGLNYWSSPTEIMREACKKYPELKKMMENN